MGRPDGTKSPRMALRSYVPCESALLVWQAAAMEWIRGEGMREEMKGYEGVWGALPELEAALDIRAL